MLVKRHKDPEEARKPFEDMMFQYRHMKTKLRADKTLSVEDKKQYELICSYVERLVKVLKPVQRQIITAKYMGEGMAHDKTVYRQVFAERMTWDQYRELEKQAYSKFVSRIAKDKKLTKLLG